MWSFCSPWPALRCPFPGSVTEPTQHPLECSCGQSKPPVPSAVEWSLIWPLKQLYEGDRTHSHSNDANKGWLIRSACCNPVPSARRGTLAQAEQESEDVLFAQGQHWSHSPHSLGAVTTCSTCVGSSTTPGSPATLSAPAGTPQNKRQTKMHWDALSALC